MKYSTNTYAKALVEALATAKGSDDERAMADRFVALVRLSGDEAHLPSILDEADRLRRSGNNTRRLVVESARALDAKMKELVASLAKDGDVIEEKVNPSLIAGVKITANDEMQFDASLKRKLDDVFGSVQ